MNLDGVLTVEGPLREVMQSTGCDPACHACFRRIEPGERGAFRPALTLYGVEWAGGLKCVDAFRCLRCLDRALPPVELLRLATYAIGMREFFAAGAFVGLNDPLRTAMLLTRSDVVAIGPPRQPIDGPGLWLGLDEEPHFVFLNGQGQWLTPDTMIRTPPETVRADWRKVVGR